MGEGEEETQGMGGGVTRKWGKWGRHKVVGR